jgi:hypothetical protein
VAASVASLSSHVLRRRPGAHVHKTDIPLFVFVQKIEVQMQLCLIVIAVGQQFVHRTNELVKAESVVVVRTGKPFEPI